ncbi:disintegrin and metalloproteinase domain-containing protein 21-like [Vicugna pacos]|uniref:Disintegrin and metalloproteinase domain-containing protein 21-like n=1 Tax=Vicugna pacos TaxID=30538 RepID=A0ABM5E5F7_VICPA
MSLSRGTQLAESQVTRRTALLLLGFWAMLAPVQCSQGHPSWRYISSEVVIPRKEFHHGKGVQMPGWLSYSLYFGGQRHVMHMKSKNIFWPGQLLLLTQDEQGALQMDFPFMPSDCYYLGYVEGIPFSMVTVDTCYGGLEGIMKLDDLAYEIKPLRYSKTFEHVVSQIVADADTMGPVHRLKDRQNGDPLFPEADISEARHKYLNSRYFALHIGVMRGFAQFSNTMYRVYQNVTKCVNYMLHMANLMDSMYAGLGIRYFVTAVLVYNVRDPTTMNDYRAYDSPYAVYHRTNLRPTVLPVSSFIVIKHGPVDFDPPLYRTCNMHDILFVGYLGRHHLMVSIIAARYTGRSFGLYFDSEDCTCMRRTVCIMSPYAALTDAFSDCSLVHWRNIVKSQGHCIYDVAWKTFNTSLISVRCGNSVVEGPERCDCGSLKQCYSNQCCNTDCSLKSGSVCDKEMCCTNCTYATPGTLCRPIQNICDLPEYCPGGTYLCPQNFHLQDGTPCTEEGYCYHGNCTDRTMHCQEIFGRHAVNADDSCYTINTKATRFGHCSRKASLMSFNPCRNADIKCGRLQCSNVTHLPRLPDHASFHQSKISQVWCWGLDTHIATGINDVGHVRNGAPCAPGKFCENNFCNASIAAITYDCNPEKCSFRGICNNRRNCHCHVGWDPPYCADKGAGGSQDSGSPPRMMRSVKQSQESVVYLRVVFGRIYAFIAALLLGVATNVKAIKTSTVHEATTGAK